MAGTGNGLEVLNRSPGPVTRLQLDRRIKCDVCEALIVPTSYKCHKKTIHNNNPLGKQWKCNQCQKNLQSKLRLAQHEKSHRSTEFDQGGNLSCNECKNVTNNRNYLTDHKRRMHLIQDGIWLCGLRGNVNSSPNRSQTATNFKNIRAFTLMFFVRNVKYLSARNEVFKGT